MNGNQTTMRTRGARLTKKTPAIPLSDEKIVELTDVFKLLADPSRLKILLALAQEGEMHVNGLCDLLGGSSQPAVSHHLTLMRARRLVAFRRDGKHNFYRLESGPLGELLDQVFADIGNGQKQVQVEEFCLSFKRTK